VPPAGKSTVGLVLAGGGARGAYEIGALSVLLPVLAERGESPRIIVGTSVGALNGAFLAAGAHRPVDEVVADGEQIWARLDYDDVLEPIASPGSIGRAAEYLGEILGVPGARVAGLLDPGPLLATLRRMISFEQLNANVADGHLLAAAVAATSAHSSRSVLFHRGGHPPATDPIRGIDYVQTDLHEDHVRASAAIPTIFPAVHVGAPEIARGWYFDGGTRLNTPIKPALTLGADRIVTIALNAIGGAPAELADEHRPDALEGAAQLIQAVLVDPLVNDVASLAQTNQMLATDDGAGRRSHKRRVPYIFIAPSGRDTIGNIATRVFRKHYAGPLGLLSSPDVALLGRTVGGSIDAAHGELLSYLFFAPEFTSELVALGRSDAERWLAETHDDGPWQLRPLTS